MPVEGCQVRYPKDSEVELVRSEGRMITVLFILRRRQDIDSAAFEDYWKNVHGPVAARLPSLRKLVQYHPYPDPYGDGLPADGIDELEFDSIESMQSALATPEGQAMLEGMENFLDTSRSGPLVVQEDIRLV